MTRLAGAAPPRTYTTHRTDMTQQVAALRELRELDDVIARNRKRVLSYENEIEEVELPALKLEAELGETRKRLDELQKEERRLARMLEQNHERRERLTERAKIVRNLREEAAVSAEMEMVRRALANGESESLSVMDQVRRLEDTVAGLTEEAGLTRAAVEPEETALREKQREAESELAALRDRRAVIVQSLDPRLRRLYEGVSRGGRREAVTVLDDEACGDCYALVPLQQLCRVRAGGHIRCEACGIIIVATAN